MRSALLAATLLTAPPAAPSPAPAPERLTVGILHAPPFTIRGENGTWTGISIDLWRQIADDLELVYELRETDLAGLVRGLQDGTLDAAVAALTVSAERERVIDFTHPFYAGGLGVATLRGTTWRLLANRILSRELAEVFAALALAIFLVGALVWLGERRVNPEQFPRGLRRGLGAAFWWSAGTVTSVGYGDITPRTVFGRMVAVIWMLLGLVIVSVFTAAASSILTTQQLQSHVGSVADLRRLRVATVASSSGEEFLRGERVRFTTRPRTVEALRALESGHVDAVVADAPILRYLAAHDLDGEVEVGATIFRTEEYGIGLPPGSPWREPLNQRLLAVTGSPAWRDLLYRYLGSDD